MSPPPHPSHGPLILGANGRIGRMFQHLWSVGHWPSYARPLWHSRKGPADLIWDIGNTLCPPLPQTPRGIIVLTGVPPAADADYTGNITTAKAALDLARDRSWGRVVLCSSVAVYGTQPGQWTESTPTAPTSDYGRAKCAMEAMARDHPHPSIALRISNVVGADSLSENAAAGPVTLTLLPRDVIPERMYIGPITLAKMMLELLNTDQSLPPVLNLSAPGSTAMDALLQAADVPWVSQTSTTPGLARVPLPLDQMQRYAPVSTQAGTPQELIRQARLAGWRPHHADE